MLKIQPLRGNHDRSRFESGSGELDLWLRQTAQQHQKRVISKTFVAIAADDPSRILGFYALTACEVVSQDLPGDLAKRLPRKVPGIRLGRLAVDRSVQGQGLGELLLMNAIDRSRRVLDYLRKEGCSGEDLTRVRAPAGIDLGARTPEEIALSVISEIVLVRRHGGGGLMRDKLAPCAEEEPPLPPATVASTAHTGYRENTP